MPTRYPQQQMHRIKYTKLTPEQIGSKLEATAHGPTSASPMSEVLAGKSLRIVLDDGPTLGYRFASGNRSALAESDGAVVDAGYGALTLDRLVLFSHLIPGTQRGYTVVVDQDTHLATVFEVWFSGYEDNREVQRQIYYGYVEDAVRPAHQRQPPPPLKLRRTGRGTASRTASKARASTGSRTTASRRSSATRPSCTRTSSSSRASAAS